MSKLREIFVQKEEPQDRNVLWLNPINALKGVYKLNIFSAMGWKDLLDKQCTSGIVVNSLDDVVDPRKGDTVFVKDSNSESSSVIQYYYDGKKWVETGIPIYDKSESVDDYITPVFKSINDKDHLYKTFYSDSFLVLKNGRVVKIQSQSIIENIGAFIEIKASEEADLFGKEIFFKKDFDNPADLIELDANNITINTDSINANNNNLEFLEEQSGAISVLDKIDNFEVTFPLKQVKFEYSETKDTFIYNTGSFYHEDLQKLFNYTEKDIFFYKNGLEYKCIKINDRATYYSYKFSLNSEKTAFELYVYKEDIDKDYIRCPEFTTTTICDIKIYVKKYLYKLNDKYLNDDIIYKNEISWHKNPYSENGKGGIIGRTHYISSYPWVNDSSFIRINDDFNLVAQNNCSSVPLRQYEACPFTEYAILKVIVDNVTYDRVIVEKEDSDYKAKIEDKYELRINEYQNSWLVFTDFVNIENHTSRIVVTKYRDLTKYDVKQLNELFIPDTIARTSELPDLSLYALKTEIPTKTSQLSNDSGYITNSELEAKNYATKDDVSSECSRAQGVEAELGETINRLAQDINEMGSDVLNKIDKVSNATADNFASLNSDGSIKDSGKKASDFTTAPDWTATSGANAISNKPIFGKGLVEISSAGSSKQIDVNIDDSTIKINSKNQLYAVSSGGSISAEQNDDYFYDLKQGDNPILSNIMTLDSPVLPSGNTSTQGFTGFGLIMYSVNTSQVSYTTSGATYGYKRETSATSPDGWSFIPSDSPLIILEKSFNDTLKNGGSPTSIIFMYKEPQ